LIKDKDGWTPLHWATFIGDLNQAIKTLETSGEKFTTKHFLIQDDQGRTPLSLAAKYFHLDQIFVPSYWKGRVGEMIDLWKEASPQSNENLNFEALRDEAIQLTMQSLPKIDLQTLNQAVRPTVSLSTSEKEMTESRKLTDLSK
jgi:ankyrin repeat protein